MPHAARSVSTPHSSTSHSLPPVQPPCPRADYKYTGNAAAGSGGGGGALTVRFAVTMGVVALAGVVGFHIAKSRGHF